ncbi:MAG: hypothetical protein EOP42_26265 [Sphingobacteriaceae bacterium]|nr:MAG: hypothetical protein EOP42_26265 [Sphingobacteriaceae bacterium]
MTAQKNNVSYNFKPVRANTYMDSMTISGYGSYNIEETLNIKIKFTGVGVYVLKGQQVNYFNTVGQDVLVSNYFVNPNTKSVINITSYDQSTNLIAGTFNLSLLKTFRYPDSTYPANINFSNGKFKVLLVK